MLIAVTGATGFIGSALCPFLQKEGHSILSIGRGPSNDVVWDPTKGVLPTNKFDGVEAVIHLAGENIAGGRWTDKQKALILESRTKGTELLSQTLAQLPTPPRVLLSGSAIGIYGNRGDEELYEDSSSGEGFLAEVVKQWEGATKIAENAGIRVTHLRTGLVQSPSDGMLKKTRLLFKLGLGGRIGSGKQFWSWISLEDELRLIHWLLTNEISGAVNLTAPSPVTNSEYTKALGSALQRPTFFTVPEFAPQLLLGKELATELLLNSLRVLPQKAIDNGFEFKHKNLAVSFPDILSE